MAIKQLSAFAGNNPGALAKIIDTLDKAQIDMKAMNVADSMDFGIVRFLVDDVIAAKTALSDEACIVKENDIVAIAVKDEPGSLKKFVHLLADNGVNIEYMYSFPTKKEGMMCMAVRVDEPSFVEQIAKANKIEFLTEDNKSLYLVQEL